MTNAYHLRIVAGMLDENYLAYNCCSPEMRRHLHIDGTKNLEGSQC